MPANVLTRLRHKPPWALFYFLPICYFTLFDQASFIPSVRAFSVGLILVIFLPWLFIRIWRRAHLPQTPLDYLFLAVLGLHLLSAALSPSFRLTYYNLWLLLLTILTFYLLLDQLQVKRENSLWKAQFLVVSLVLELALLEFFIWYLGLLPALGFEVSWPEVAGWTFPPQPRRLGLGLITVPMAPPFSAYVVMLVPLALGLALSSRQRAIRLGVALFLPISLIILLLTFSRTGLVTLAVGLITFAGLAGLMMWLAQRQTQPDRLNVWSGWWAGGMRAKRFIIIIIGVIILFAPIFWSNRDYFGNQIFENRGGSNEIRLSLIQAALLMWQDHPLVGIGPGLFGLFYRNYIPANSFFLLSLNTHSFYFQMLAEEGILGLGLALVIAVVTIKTAYQRLMAVENTGAKWRFIGVISALAGFFVSAGIEQLWWPAFIIPICLLAAYVYHDPLASTTSLPTSLPGLRRWLPSIYLALLLIFAGVLFYVNGVADHFGQLTETVKPGQEQTVAQELGRLQTLDPGLPIYGLAQAHYLGQQVNRTVNAAPCAPPPDHIPEAEQALLAEAIRRYEQGLQPVKGHPLDWANLASLYWLNRQPEAAQAALNQALNLSSLNDAKIDIYLLNSGCYYELQNDPAAAITAYSKLLQRTPRLVSSLFWQATTFRIEHLPQIINTAVQTLGEAEAQLDLAIELAQAQNKNTEAAALISKLTVNFPDSPTTQRRRAQTLLRQGQYQASLALAAKINDEALMGEITLAQGNWPAAQTHLKKALFISPDSPEVRFQLAQLALAQDNSAEAIRQLIRLTRPYSRPTTGDSRFIYGYSTNFAIYDTLLILTPPPLQGQPFGLLAQLYEQAGQPGPAEEVRQALLSYDPFLK